MPSHGPALSRRCGRPPGIDQGSLSLNSYIFVGASVQRSSTTLKAATRRVSLIQSLPELNPHLASVFHDQPCPRSPSPCFSRQPFMNQHLQQRLIAEPLLFRNLPRLIQIGLRQAKRNLHAALRSDFRKQCRTTNLRSPGLRLGRLLFDISAPRGTRPPIRFFALGSELRHSRRPGCFGFAFADFPRHSITPPAFFVKGIPVADRHQGRRP